MASAQLVWDRAYGLAIEVSLKILSMKRSVIAHFLFPLQRPKSMSTEGLLKLVA